MVWRKENEKSGFTLIELLVVMAIIAVLASILFPVFSRARAKAQSTACLSNVKQLSLALMMYSQDYDGYLPKYTTQVLPVVGDTSQYYYTLWTDLLLPYTSNKQIQVCPSRAGNTLKNGSGEKSVPEDWNYAPGYGNPTIVTVVPVLGLNLVQVVEPAEKYAFADSLPINSEVNVGTAQSTVSGKPNRIFMRFDCTQPYAFDPPHLYAGPHNEGYNVAFCDGHVKWLPKERMFFNVSAKNPWIWNSEMGDTP